MLEIFSAARLGAVRVARLLCLLGCVAFGGCAIHYVDGNTKEVSSASFRKPGVPQPVQLLFEFQSKGTLNARATEALKTWVADQVKESGLFAAIDDTPVPSGALLSVTLNNVPITDNAFTKGFVTGMTFGLVGSQVTDGYVCTVKYLSNDQPTAIVKTARHAIHTTIGASGAPPNSVKADNITAAVRTMTHQVLSTALNDLSQDPEFK
jgi:hypothetical protein